jgi:hypothetical protein
MCICIVFKNLNKDLNPNRKVLVDKHLNFDVRYDGVINGIVIHKNDWFHTQQICPSIAKCQRGKRNEDLCHLPDHEGFKFAKDGYGPTDNMKDLVIGKLVRINEKGEVTFHDLDGDEHKLDLNWKNMCNMARSIIDEQLLKIVNDGNWKKKSVWVNPGIKMLDNDLVHVDQ